MTFEHYMRSGNKMLRMGFTTGTCAALAAAGAARLLLTGRAPAALELTTPRGIPVRVLPEETGFRGGAAYCAVRKDGGDDQDATDGILIFAFVRRSSAPGIEILGGAGVGTVTRPGLSIPPGRHAINPVPLRMIRQAVSAELASAGLDDGGAGLEVTISVPAGAEIARKTFNPRMGIEGGISIIGTSGIVEPMSEQALIDTIRSAIEQARAESPDLILVPGNYGETYVRDVLGIEGIPLVQFSNYLGDALDICSLQKFRRVLAVGHVGKMVKIAAGVMNTHSRYADGRREILAAHAAALGADTETVRAVMEAVTTDAMLDILEEKECRKPVMEAVTRAAGDHIERRAGGKFRAGLLIFSNVYGELGRTEEADKILREWEEET